MIVTGSTIPSPSRSTRAIRSARPPRSDSGSSHGPGHDPHALLSPADLERERLAVPGGAPGHRVTARQPHLERVRAGVVGGRERERPGVLRAPQPVAVGADEEEPAVPRLRRRSRASPRRGGRDGSTSPGSARSGRPRSPVGAPLLAQDPAELADRAVRASAARSGGSMFSRPARRLADARRAQRSAAAASRAGAHARASARPAAAPTSGSSRCSSIALAPRPRRRRR